MKISEALNKRISCRSFLSKKVNKKIIKNIIKQAAKSPSGGNLQPWQVFVIADKKLKNLIKDVEKELIKFPKGHVQNMQFIQKICQKFILTEDLGVGKTCIQSLT